MTDIELLKLAAKAAGWEATKVDERGWFYVSYSAEYTEWELWNSLEDDGDALRLAVKLNLTIGHDEVLRMCWIRQCGTFTGKYEAGEIWGTDKWAATRRAIVRAAAEIGKAMP